MQGSYGPAILHVQSGMKILSEVKYNAITGHHEHNVLGASGMPYVSMDVLERLFVGLDLQVTQVRRQFCACYVF
jgi:hypothetical protein